MTTKEIICVNCGKSHLIDLGEYNYQVRRGRKNFFCSNVCSGQYNNARNKKPVIQKACEYCGNTFDCHTPYTKRFCSRSCASAGSITEKRLEGNRKGGLNCKEGHDAYAIQKLLRVREQWRYSELSTLLESFNIEHEFEYVVDGKYIFDLYLPSINLLVEFDEDYHNSPKQQDVDKIKAECASSNGYQVKRISVESGSIIPGSILGSTLSEYYELTLLN